MSHVLNRLLGRQDTEPGKFFKLDRALRAGDELSRFVDDLLEGIKDDESRALTLARWVAENITNAEPKKRGTLATFRERRGLCGARARLYVELAERARLKARIFGMYNPGMRHTAVQAWIKGKWRFIDPMYGGVFRVDGELLSFEEMRQAPEDAANALVVLGGTADLDGRAHGREDHQLDHIAKLRNLYSAERLATARSYGFLYGVDPVFFYPEFDLCRLQGPIEIGSDDGNAKEFTRTASANLRCPLPNALGATMASGVAVIVTEFPGQPEIVSDNTAVVWSCLPPSRPRSQQLSGNFCITGRKPGAWASLPAPRRSRSIRRTAGQKKPRKSSRMRLHKRDETEPLESGRK